MRAPFLTTAGAVAALLQGAFAAPAPKPTLFEHPTPVVKRQDGLAAELAIIESLLTVGVDGVLDKVAVSEVVSILQSITPTASPSTIDDVPSLLSSIAATATPSGYLEGALNLILNGLVDLPDLFDVIEGSTTYDTADNSNPEPTTTIYPKKESCDAPYTQTQETLLEQIYIPPTFTYGEKPPVILFPGTGGRAGVNFAGNFEITFKDVDYADLVYVNPTSFLLADAQLSAELAAYAINYISAISGGKNVSLIAWSQGNINIQWATKYWPSTRCIVSDHVAISPDYHGTILANLIDPLEVVTFPPSLLQQQYSSNFITTLRSNGGDSAYVPTTNVYSAFFDEIVEPQQNPNASAILNDAHGVGVTNAEIQAVCGADSVAGFIQDHASMISSSLAYALAVDALTHDGPGLVSRIDLTTVCAEFLAPGLDLADFLATENDLVVALAAILLYPSPTLSEPAISAYATESPTTCGKCAASTSSSSIKSSSTSSTSSKKTSSTSSTSTTTKSSSSSSTKKTSTTSTKEPSSTSSTEKVSSTSSTKKTLTTSTTKASSTSSTK